MDQGTVVNQAEVVGPAFMSSYHQVLRNDLEHVLTPLAHRGQLAEFAEAWRDYRTAASVHTAMEEGLESSGGGGIDLLNHWYEASANAPLSMSFLEEHGQEEEAQRLVTVALAQGHNDLLRALSAYRQVAEAHMDHEEEVLRPLVEQLPPPSASLFSRWCLTAGAASYGFEHFVAHGVTSFATLGSQGSSPERAIAEFLHSLQSGCSEAQWALIHATARAAAYGPIWSSVMAEMSVLQGVGPV
jgi:hypothetical protein